MHERRRRFIFLVALLSGTLILLLQPALADAPGERERGTLTVYNYTDRRITVCVGSRDQATIERGSYAMFDVRTGHHLVWGTWDTGNCKKYCNVDPYWGYDYCYFYQRDIY